MVFWHLFKKHDYKTLINIFLILLLTFGTYKLCNYANRAFSNSDAYKSFFEENTDRFDDNENVIIDSGSRWNIAEIMMYFIQ